MTIIEIDGVDVDFFQKSKEITNISRSEEIFQCLLLPTIENSILHVVCVISNPCNYRRRVQLFNEFSERMLRTEGIIMYVVEMAYGDQEHTVTQSGNPNHLQLRTEIPLWHKENMINLGIKYLLPKDWKYVAWIDADIEFLSPDWALNAVKILQNFDIMQLFYESSDLNYDGKPKGLHRSFCSKYCLGKKFEYSTGLDYWHPGYAWACTREFYDKVNGLYEVSILGSGDYILSQCLLSRAGGIGLHGIKMKIKEYIARLGSVKDVKVGFLPVKIRHYYHGTRKNRKYAERNDVLRKYNFDPDLDLIKDEIGILIPSEHMCIQFREDIMSYFQERNEDDYYSLIE